MSVPALLRRAPALILAVCCCVAFAAAKPAAEPAKDVFAHLEFRNLGPAVAGGRVAAVAGIPGDPRVYYVGAAGGGVFKTTDGGLRWKPVFAHEATGSIGAIALAPENPNLVWVGTGEANIRNDVIGGTGVYLSTDAGASWKRMGLEKVGQIARIVVDPHDSNHVLVAALGHEWGANPERGVYETTDGGKTWTKTLFVDDRSGAIDLALQPGNGQVVFAATWQAWREPWMLHDGGPGSGIWRSTDGGSTWKRLTEGLPKGPIGRIGLAIAPSEPQKVYALVEAPIGQGALFVSDDLGDHWQKVSDNHALSVRGFYFSTLEVAPNDAGRVYFSGFQLLRSDDGGKTVRVIDEHVHVDHHALWIDPADPKRMIQGNDGGAYLSFDAGKSWRFLDGLPIEQSYMVAADGRTPYRLCTGLQDNGGWCGPSSSLADRVVSGNDWYTVVGGDGEYTVPAPSDPDVVYSDAEDGAVVRFDLKTKQTKFIMPYLHGPAFVNDIPTSEQRIRFNWTPPIAVAPKDADTIYLGGNVLLKSSDGGDHWSTVSPDLTRNDKDKQKLSGGPIHYDLSGAETYDTLLSVAIAASDPQAIWTGSDDGLVQVTRDGGQTWNDVTPSGAPKWARVYQIDVSNTDPGTAYVAFDAHQLDDDKPYVYATHDYGKSWRSIAGNLPADAAVVVVRADPARPQVLAAGTMRGLWVSRDGGRRWTQLKANLPTMPVWDLKFVRGDLVLATHGRGLWVADHFAAMAELDPEALPKQLTLFTPGSGIEFQRWRRGQGAEPAYAADNAPGGVILDYYLPKKLEASAQQKKLEQTPVKVEVRDAQGQLIATRYGKAEAGVDRFVWDMRYDGPTKLDFEKPSVEGKAPEWATGPRGPLVLPGAYAISVTADGHTETTQAQVSADPNQPPALQAQRQSLQAALAARAQATALNRMLNRISAMQKQLSSFEDAVAAKAASSDPDQQAAAKTQQGLVDQAKSLGKKLGALKDSVYDPKVQHTVIEDELHQLTDLQGAAGTVARSLGGLGTQALPPQLLQLAQETDASIAAKLAVFNALLAGDVAAYDQAAYAAGAPTLAAGKPIDVAAPPSI
ncbi:MAG: glycosyl hydrolase [Gammaproteobacteria bacterium]|nr:glycosyl hydrolase [Gammaproteobacteria bacterium]